MVEIPDAPYLVITRKQMHGEPLLLHDYAGTSPLDALRNTWHGITQVSGAGLAYGGHAVADIAGWVSLAAALCPSGGCQVASRVLGGVSAIGSAIAGAGNAIRGHYREAVFDYGRAALAGLTWGISPAAEKLAEVMRLPLTTVERGIVKGLQIVFDLMQQAVRYPSP